MNISECRVCSSKDLEDVIDLGDQPWCNDFISNEGLGSEKKYPLVCCFCKDCSTLQVRYTVPKEIMYADHSYLSGSNKSMPKHFQAIADYVTNNYCSNKKDLFAVDIGSNDGTLLQTYKNNDFKVLGIEASKEIARKAEGSGIPTLGEYFDENLSNEIKRVYGKATVISAANVFYHVEELHSVVKGIKNLLSKDGVFVIQASYLPNLIETKAFDIMYHEHLLYYRLENLNYLLNLHGLEVFNYSFESVHGGSIIAYACHKNAHEIQEKVPQLIEQERKLGYHLIDTYKQFNQSIKVLRNDLRELINKLKGENKTIAAYGAPAKGTVMLNYCGLDSDSIDYAVEVNEMKVNKYIPGTGIKIHKEGEIEDPDLYLLLSWNFLEFFLENRKSQNKDYKFIVPIPNPHIS